MSSNVPNFTHNVPTAKDLQEASDAILASGSLEEKFAAADSYIDKARKAIKETIEKGSLSGAELQEVLAINEQVGYFAHYINDARERLS